MKMFDLRGSEVMDIHEISRVGDDLVIKGKIMKSMPMTVCSRPEELIRSLGLLNWPVIWYLPVIAAKGLWRVAASRIKPGEKGKRATSKGGL